MAREYRLVILTLDELAEAFRSYRRQVPGFLGDGQLGELRVKQDVVEFDLTISVAGAAATQVSGKVPLAELREVLIRFCNENNIMVARAASKAVKVINGEVALEMRLSSLTG